MNASAAARTDSEFNKNPKFVRWLRRRSTQPLLPRHLGTLGGVRISARAEAVDAKGVKILASMQ